MAKKANRMARELAELNNEESFQPETRNSDAKMNSLTKDNELELTDLKGLVRGEVFRMNIEKKIKEIEKILEDFNAKRSQDGHGNPFVSNGVGDFISELASTRKLIRYDDLTRQSQRVLITLIKKILVFGQRKLSAFFRKTVNAEQSENGQDVYIDEISYLLNDICDICYSYSSTSNDFISHFQRFQMDDEVRAKGSSLLLSLIHNRYIVKFKSSALKSSNQLNYWLKYLFRSASRAIAFICSAQGAEDSNEAFHSFKQDFLQNENPSSKVEFALNYLAKWEVFGPEMFERNMLLVLNYLDSRPFADTFTQLPDTSKNILITFIENLFDYSYRTIVPLIEQIKENQSNPSTLFSTESSTLLMSFVVQSSFLQHVTNLTLNISNRTVYFCNQLNKSDKGLVLFMKIIQNPLLIDYSSTNMPNDIVVKHQLFTVFSEILGVLLYL